MSTKGDVMMMPLFIFIVLCFILVYLVQIVNQLKEIKEMMRTKQLTELSKVIDDYEEKE